MTFHVPYETGAEERLFNQLVLQSSTSHIDTPNKSKIDQDPQQIFCAAEPEARPQGPDFYDVMLHCLPRQEVCATCPNAGQGGEGGQQCLL